MENSKFSIFDLNLRKITIVLLILLLIACLIVIIVDSTKPISYGVAYTLYENNTKEAYVFYRNNTYKAVASGTNYNTKIYGTYTLSVSKNDSGKHKWIKLDSGQSFQVVNIKKISAGSKEFKSTLSDGIITCIILVLISGFILLMMVPNYKKPEKPLE